MVKNVDQCFPKSKMTFSNVLFCPQLKDIQFTVIEDQRNQKILTFKKQESEKFDLKNGSNSKNQSIIKIVGN